MLTRVLLVASMVATVREILLQWLDPERVGQREVSDDRRH